MATDVNVANVPPLWGIRAEPEPGRYYWTLTDAMLVYVTRAAALRDAADYKTEKAEVVALNPQAEAIDAGRDLGRHDAAVIAEHREKKVWELRQKLAAMEAGHAPPQAG